MYRTLDKLLVSLRLDFEQFAAVHQKIRQLVAVLSGLRPQFFGPQILVVH